MTSAKRVALAAIAAMLSQGIWANGFVLVTPDEFSRELVAAEADEERLRSARRDPLAPEILVDRPEQRDDYASPIDIVVRFLPQDGASIDLDTLKITYGVLGIDVTDRVIGNAKVTEAGIDAREAEMPAGRHRLTVIVADSEGRIGKRRFKFRVVD